MYCLKRHNLNISARVLARVMQANLSGDRNATQWGWCLQVLASAELPMIISSKLLALQIDDREGTSGRAQTAGAERDWMGMEDGHDPWWHKVGK